MSTAADPSDGAGLSLHENAEKILMYLKTQENERASTTALRNATGLSAANISGHHALTLIEKGLIEKVGTEVGEAPKDTNVYELTHRGRKEANDLLKQNEAPMSEEDQVRTIRHLVDRVDELESELAAVDAGSGSRSEAAVSREEFERLRERVDDFDEALDIVYDKLEEIYGRLSKL